MIKAAVLATSMVTSVHDGDTFSVDLANCPVPVTCQDIPVRLRGYDAPELNDKRLELRTQALKARARLLEFLDPKRTLELRNVSRDKYFRLDADVWSDDIDVGKALQTEGLVRPYNGEGPKPW